MLAFCTSWHCFCFYHYSLITENVLLCAQLPGKSEIIPHPCHSPITRRQILDWSKSKQSADNNFKFYENNRKFFKQVENTVGKGEIARYEQFLLFPQCFQKAYFPRASKGVIVWERIPAI